MKTGLMGRPLSRVGSLIIGTVWLTAVLIGGASAAIAEEGGALAVADLEAGDAEHVARAAAEHHLEVMPLGAYHYGVGACPEALVLGFGAVRPTVIRSGVARLARVHASQHTLLGDALANADR
jgi:DNA-binding transcriptional MocR family regulator